MPNQPSPPPYGVVDAVVSDGLETALRIRDDVRHLRDVGKRAALAGRVAVNTAKVAIAGAVGAFADGVARAQQRADERRRGRGRVK